MLGETPMAGFHISINMCEGVGQDSGCGHEESHLMHNMIYSLYDVCVCAIACTFRWGVSLLGKFNY